VHLCPGPRAPGYCFLHMPATTPGERRPSTLLGRLGLDRPELRAWAMYDWANSAFLTVVVTASLIPLELWEIFHHFTSLKVFALVLNIAIVWYLIHLLREK